MTPDYQDPRIAHNIETWRTSNYEKYKLLASFTKLNKLFCWPCLFFYHTKNTVWNKKGYSDLGNLSNAISRHEKTKSPMSSCLQNASFGRARIDLQPDEQTRQHVSAYNLAVHKNREILRRFIDVVCYLGKQELSFRGWVDLKDSVNRGNDVELAKLISICDSLLEQHLKTATVFSGMSNHIQNDLIVAVKQWPLIKIWFLRKRHLKSVNYKMCVSQCITVIYLSKPTYISVRMLNCHFYHDFI